MGCFFFTKSVMAPTIASATVEGLAPPCPDGRKWGKVSIVHCWLLCSLQFETQTNSLTAIRISLFNLRIVIMIRLNRQKS